MSPLDLHGRHGTNAPPVHALWKCVACGTENSGPLEMGCASCGSGKPGSHVGVPPPAAPIAGAEIPAGHEPTTVEAAYLRWLKTNGMKQVDPVVNELLFDAFQAGFQVGISQVAQQAVPLSGTAETRTVIAALRLFLENILPTASEEIQSGEFLSIEETQRLIQRLERTQ